jgi:hypothetical protein
MPASRIHRALVLGWAAVILGVTVPGIAPRLAELAATLAVGWPHASFAVLAAGWGAHLRVLAVAGLAGLALWAAGALPALWLQTPGTGGFLLGAGAVGLLGLGLAAVRLFYPGLLVLSFLLPALAGWHRRSPVRLPPGGGAARFATVAALVLLVPWMLVPESHPDGWEYFLAGPERMLAAHGISVLGATPPLHYPALAETLYALPVWLDADAAAKWLNAFALAAGALALVSTLPGAGWMGLLLLATSSTTAALAASGKNEGFAAGFVMLSLAGAWRGRWPASAVAGGLALSTKYLSALNVAWVPLVCFLPPGRIGLPFLGRWIVVALAVAAPWYAKSWALTGDPAYPVLSGLFPSLQAGWDARNAAVWTQCPGGTGGPAGGARALVAALLREHAGLVLLLPFVLAVPGATRRAVLGALATLAVWYAAFDPTQLPRWSFPALAPVLVLAGGSAAALTGAGTLSRWLLGGAVATGWLGAIAGHATGHNPLPCALGLESRAAYRGRVLTTFVPAREFLAAHPEPGALLLCGEMREYRLPKPCRLAGAHASGEAPLFWRLTHECPAASRVATRLRQLGVTRILVNPVLGMTNASSFTPFAWDLRQVRLQAGFVGRWWDLEFAPPRTDALNGCTYVYRLRRAPHAQPASPLLQLPGTESEVAPAAALASAGFLLEARRRLAAACRSMPPVLQYGDLAAWISSEAGDWETAWRLVRPSVDAGALDDQNFHLYAQASLITRRWTEALRGYALMRAAYPGWDDVADRFSAEARFQMAMEGLGRGQAREAETVATEALNALPPPNRSLWRPRLAGLLHGARALARFRLDRTADARADLADGAATLPDLASLTAPGPLAAFLRDRAASMLPSHP